MTTEIGWTWCPDGKGGSKIGRTWNPQVGCREVSPACRECYAAKLAHRGMSPQHKGLTVMRTNAAGENLGVHWNGKINRVPALLAQPLRWRKPSGIFVGSMTDLFFDVSTEDACRWIAAIFGIMAACPQHTFMLLTKRPDLAARWFAWLDEQAKTECEVQDVCMRAVLRYMPEAATRMRAQQEGPHDMWPLSNVWLGVTAEDQQRADERVPVLLGLPAAVRFVSYEPACGPVDWTRIKWPGRKSTVDVLRGGSWDLDATAGFVQHSDMATLDQIIAGGESGPGARPAHPDWFRSTRDQCASAHTAFFFKQWGAFSDANDSDAWSHYMAHDGAFAARGSPMPASKNGPRDPGTERVVTLCRVGVRAAGRDLDGRTHDGFPAVPCG